MKFVHQQEQLYEQVGEVHLRQERLMDELLGADFRLAMHEWNSIHSSLFHQLSEEERRLLSELDKESPRPKTFEIEDNPSRIWTMTEMALSTLADAALDPIPAMDEVRLEGLHVNESSTEPDARYPCDIEFTGIAALGGVLFQGYISISVAWPYDEWARDVLVTCGSPEDKLLDAIFGSRIDSPVRRKPLDETEVRIEDVLRFTSDWRAYYDSLLSMDPGKRLAVVLEERDN